MGVYTEDIRKGSANMRDRIYYITDTYGTYYSVNSMNKLVAMNHKDLATKFTYSKANAVLQKTVKPSNRYQYILVEAGESISSLPDREIRVVTEEDFRETRFDSLDTDWLGYLEDMLSFVSQLQQYRNNLNYLLSEVDKEICDIMHYIEFNCLDAAKGYKVYKMLRECRLRRRKIKDEEYKVTVAIQALSEPELPEKLKSAICQIRGMERRQYKPRVLEELFEHVS